jgi:hypothetical protein
MVALAHVGLQEPQQAENRTVDGTPVYFFPRTVSHFTRVSGS